MLKTLDHLGCPACGLAMGEHKAGYGAHLCRYYENQLKLLGEKMEFDHVIRVLPNGEIEDVQGIWAPELYNVVKPEDFTDPNWELLNGYSGQDRYPGPIMHDSEYIGGALARDILENPGIYVAVASYYLNEDEDPESEPCTVEGWAIARYIGDKT